MKKLISKYDEKLLKYWRKITSKDLLFMKMSNTLRAYAVYSLQRVVVIMCNVAIIQVL